MVVNSQLLITFLLNALWQIPLIAAIAALCLRLVRRVPAAYHHVLWVIALGLCLGLPLASLRDTTTAHSNANVFPSQITANDDTDFGGHDGHIFKRFSFIKKKHIRPVIFTPLLSWILIGCYVGLFIYRVARIAWSLRATLKLREAAYPRALPGPLYEIAKLWTKAFDRQKVAILCSPNIVGPVTLSSPRPTLIFPETFFNRISECDFSSALCHELAHIQRHDFLLNLVYEIISVPTSFHPVAMWIKNRIAVTRELACDEAAAAKLSTRCGYARSLLNIARSVGCGPSARKFNWALGLFDTNTLEERIMNLLERSKRVSRKWGILLAVAASSLLTVACVGISAFSLQVARPEQAPSDVQPFVGTWKALHDGTPFMVLELHLEKGKLVGGIRVCSFRMDTEGTGDFLEITDKTLTESLPIYNFVVSGKSLSFDWKDPDGDEDHLKLEITGKDAGRINWLGLPDGLKATPIPVSKETLKNP